ncbi:hypothetical protein [Kibdelosporangium phytohabitans]|uniref:Uncharacterized protein n=1 Tax=Kibdelosporangium phytohabitans TaxID=860235 RepID=A0A0N9HT89_9PSEU|nr:hypothetical protein [Kibdelosporangium phytohabitans]ALG08193.1 hypothetical protein AOZ06_15900 [Kibdelosporangium phytohabitans]MBE1470804.1 hypothetical protein [Kibdelosporangium phytohabitans]
MDRYLARSHNIERDRQGWVPPRAGDRGVAVTTVVPGFPGDGYGEFMQKALAHSGYNWNRHGRRRP